MLLSPLERVGVPMPAPLSVISRVRTSWATPTETVTVLAWACLAQFERASRVRRGRRRRGVRRRHGRWARQYPQFRHGQRLVTAVWGIALLGEAVIRAALTFVLPTGVMVVLNHVLPLVIIAILVIWTIAFGKRRSAARVAAAAAAARDTPA